MPDAAEVDSRPRTGVSAATGFALLDLVAVGVLRAIGTLSGAHAPVSDGALMGFQVGVLVLAVIHAASALRGGMPAEPKAALALLFGATAMAMWIAHLVAFGAWALPPDPIARLGAISAGLAHPALAIVHALFVVFGVAYAGQALEGLVDRTFGTRIFRWAVSALCWTLLIVFGLHAIDALSAVATGEPFSRPLRAVFGGAG